jgi:hypothetical protein
MKNGKIKKSYENEGNFFFFFLFIYFPKFFNSLNLIKKKKKHL